MMEKWKRHLNMKVTQYLVGAILERIANVHTAVIQVDGWVAKSLF